MSLYVDTWGWLVLEDRLDPAHGHVDRLYRRLRSKRERVFTSDYVLDETITRLFQRRPFLEAKRFIDAVLEAGERGYLAIETVDPARFREAWLLRLRFDDQPAVSFTDLTSFVIMRERRIPDALTADRHFRIAGFNLVP